MSVLTRITTRAKQIYKKGKAGISWVAAIKRASAQVKGKASPKRKRSRKVTRRRRRVSGIVRNPKLLAAGVGKGPRKNQNYITVPNVSGIGRISRKRKAAKRTRGRKKSVSAAYKKELLQKFAHALLQYDQAKTIKATKAAQKRKVKYRKILRAL